ncbi:MAG: tRNA pseudouridine(55) synthase TruB [Saprospiraceae bacterium]
MTGSDQGVVSSIHIPEDRILNRPNRTVVHPDMAREGLLLLLDKPSGWTSFDVVNKVRWVLRKRFGLRKFKVGHAGTLDPMATGLLLICTGPFTKKLQDLQGMDKVYSGTVTLGGITASYDADSPVEQVQPLDGIDMPAIHKAMEPLIGDILQVPPVYSALKVDGQRAYAMARKGQSVELAARPVRIDSFHVSSLEGDQLPFVVHCGKGTYIRSLAHDLGQALGCGGYLSELRREGIGTFSVQDALTVSEFEAWANPNPEEKPTAGLEYDPATD